MCAIYGQSRAYPKEEEKSEKAENKEQEGREAVCDYSDTGGKLPENNMTKEVQTSNSVQPDWHLSSLSDRHAFDHRAPNFVSLALCFLFPPSAFHISSTLPTTCDLTCLFLGIHFSPHRSTCDPFSRGNIHG